MCRVVPPCLSAHNCTMKIYWTADRSRNIALLCHSEQLRSFCWPGKQSIFIQENSFVLEIVWKNWSVQVLGLCTKLFVFTSWKKPSRLIKTAFCSKFYLMEIGWIIQTSSLANPNVHRLQQLIWNMPLAIGQLHS